MKKIIKTVNLTLILLLFPVLLLAQSTVKADILYMGTNGQLKKGVRCGTLSPTQKQQTEMQPDIDRTLSTEDIKIETLDAVVNIPVAFHVVREDNGLSIVSDGQIYDQLDVLNAAFSNNNANFQFSLNSIDRTDNTQWSHHQPGDQYELEMKQALAIDPSTTLNYYICSEIGSGILSYTQLPGTFPEGDVIDGVVVIAGTLPGGDAYPYDEGDVGTHEVGHYLGLLHTFENGCKQPGDYVDDTPYESMPAYDCNERLNSCKKETALFDPIHNYMDFTDDACMYEFTPGQVTRMNQQVALYRLGLLGGGTEPVITSTPITTATIKRIYSYDDDNTVEATGTYPITFSLLSGPIGFKINSDGVVSWTPRKKHIGTNFVEISATNEYGSFTQSYEITVNTITNSAELVTLEESYPNPFNPSTTIRFAIPKEENVTLSIYNMNGQLMRTLVSSRLASGQYNITWEGDNEQGIKVASGMYFYRITAGSFIETKKTILMK